MVVGSTIYSESWKVMYNVVSGNFLLGSIYASFPDPIAGKPPSFPLAVLDNTEVITENFVVGQGDRMNELTIPITVYTKSRQQLDVASDQVSNGIKNSRQVLMESGLGNITINNGGQGMDLIGDRQKIHFKTLLIGATFVG